MFRPIDVITIGYLLLLSVIILFCRGNLQRPLVFVVLHLFIIILIVVLVTLGQRARGGLVHFFREWYPGLFFIFGFEETGFLVDMVTPQRIHNTLIAMDQAIFGTHPTVWLQQYARPWLTEVMMFCFSSFYFLLPLVGLIFYFKRKYSQLRELLLTSGITFYICFVAFIFFPAEGPWVTMTHLHQEPLRGGPFSLLVKFVESHGSIRGGAFPSSHVAVALVVLVVAFRHHRTIFWFLLPIITGLLVSTVYGRFHYAVDVVSGLLVGIIGLVMGLWIQKRWSHVVPKTVPEK